jgi:hypothetical protein
MRAVGIADSQVDALFRFPNIDVRVPWLEDRRLRLKFG